MKKMRQSAGEGEAEDLQDVAAFAVKQRDRTAKQQAVAELLCRWWYALPEWPPQDEAYYHAELEKRKLRQVTIHDWEWVPEEEQGRRKVYQLSQFRGLYRDSVGELVDLRPQDTCPCFTNLMKKELPELLDLLVIAYEKQLEDLVNSKYNEEKLKQDLRVKLTKLKERAYQAKQVGGAPRRR